MPAMHFTDADVVDLKAPKDKAQIDYFENRQGRSLVLTVGSTRKTWSVLFYVHGKPRRKKLGYFGYHDDKHPKLTSKQAREAVRTFDVKAALTKVEAGSFKEVGEEWFKRRGSALWSRVELRRHLDKLIYPAWKDAPFADIRRREVNTLLDKIADERGAKQADAVLATIRSIMNWHQSRDENYTSPIVKGMRRDTRKPDERARKRTLANLKQGDVEVRNVWNAAEKLGGSFGAIVRLCLLTGQRKTKVAQMKWDDINLKTGEWVIANEAGQKGVPEMLLLPQMALDIIKAQPKITPNPYVFATSRSRKQKHGHFNAWSQRKRELDKMLPPMPQWQVHDLRRTARSLLSRLGVSKDLAERILGHKQEVVVEIYDQHKYPEEMGEALAKLANEIARIKAASARSSRAA